ncbi:MAG: class I SAM-dependent methyltransferase [DPANN group archaeon]|nr:class I SAM-dependent methyltransferase [DPANN group archaeon]
MESRLESEAFDEYQKKTMYYWWPQIKKFLRMFEIKSSHKILDVAAGPANFAIELSKQYKAKVIATDLSNEMLILAKQNVRAANASKLVKIVKDDAKNMHFKSNSFDFVFCRYTLHQIPNPLLALNEMWRVTKPRGKIFVYDLVRPKNNIELKQSLSNVEKLYKEEKIKLWRVMLNAAADSLSAGLAENEVMKLLKKSNISNFKITFENGTFRSYRLIATKK